MTDEEQRQVMLSTLRQLAAEAGPNEEFGIDAIEFLLSEIDRLREQVKRLEWGSCDGCGGRHICTECKAQRVEYDDNWNLIGKHKPDCPVFNVDGTVK